MAMSQLLTSKELLDRSGLANQKTLTRWAQRGLIPPPTITTHPSGRGKIGCWELWVLQRVQEVQRRQARGESLDQIASELGQDWEREKKRLTRQRPDIVAMLSHDIERDLKRMQAFDNFADWTTQMTLSFIETIGMRRPANASDLVRTLRGSPLIDRALELLREGHSPLLVIIGKEVKVIPNFLLASALAQPELSNQPALILPIHTLLVEAVSEIEPKLPKKPKYAPATRVLDRTGKEVREREYHHNGPWGFAVDN